MLKFLSTYFIYFNIYFIFILKARFVSHLLVANDSFVVCGEDVKT